MKAIGVCNFEIKHLQHILTECDVNEVGSNSGRMPSLPQQIELKDFCKKHHIYLEAWSPLMSSREVLNNDIVQNIAKQYNKTPAQVIIRWHLQSETIVIPKSSTPSRIEVNFNVFDFELSADDMKKIAGLDRNKRTVPKPSEIKSIVKDP